MADSAPAPAPLDPDATVREVLRACVQEGEPLCLVDSPPGAGKTRLIEQIVALAVGHGHQRVYCVTPGADQAADLVRRLVNHYELPRVELLWSASRREPVGVAGMAVITDDPA